MKFSDLYDYRIGIGRRDFLLCGIVLFVLKAFVDAAVMFLFFGRPWTPWLYLSPIRSNWSLHAGDDALLATMLGISLPFAALGLLLTFKRIRASGLPLWLAIMFVFPVLNLILFTLLVIVPNRQDMRKQPESVRRVSWYVPLSICIAVSIALAWSWISTNWLGSYGFGLFVATPFMIGYVTVAIAEIGGKRSWKRNIGLGTLSVCVAGAVMLAAGFEGAICLLMMLPLAVPLGCLGAAVAHAVSHAVPDPDRRNSPSQAFILPLLLPICSGLDLDQQPPIHEVRTSVVVAADMDRVWRNVVSFPPLAEPEEAIFKLGISYPTRATIDGAGVGAIRRCEFSSGTFVEPITVWDPPNLLEFAVTENPEPMREWSPYSLHPPHLKGYMVSKQGRFALTRIDDGHTRLEGTTWYSHGLWPSWYWRIWSDQIIHTIHRRVLEHIRIVSEKR